MTEYELNIDWINRVSLGLEFPTPNEIDEDLLFCMALDLLVFRVVVLKWNIK